MKLPNEVSEAPGLYGTFVIEEKLIQQIWHDGDFEQKNLRTSEGDSLEIINPGKWNLSEEGPDFKGASISMNQVLIAGDVEIHLDEKDWKKHGHGQDPAYEKVILHVVLHPPKGKSVGVCSMGKRPIPRLVLLPHLRKSMEEHAEEAAMEKLSGNSSSKTLPQNFPQNWKQAKQWARERWVAKCNFAAKRVESAGWETACHQWFLEVLGSRRNRTPMARIADLFPISSWKDGLDPESVYCSQKNWKLRGCRPANHPRKRLHQYCQLFKACPDWTESLQKLAFVDGFKMKENFKINRQELNLRELEYEFAENVLGRTISGTRLHTLMVDACLPLWSTYHGRDAFESWFHWRAGDAPSRFRAWCKEKDLANRSRPFVNGLVQAIIHASLYPSFEKV